MSRWFALPWCADSDKVESATKLGAAQHDEAATGGTGATTTAASTGPVTGCRRADKPTLVLKAISEDNSDGLPIKLAQRQLLAFPATPEEIKATRLAILYGCC